MSREEARPTPAEKDFHRQQASRLRPEEMEAIVAAAPTERERLHRRAVLEDVTRRQEQDGLRRCAPVPDRAKQFAPFDALTGYNEMLQAICEADAQFGFIPPDRIRRTGSSTY